MSARILIVGDSGGPFVERGLAARLNGHQVYWFSDVEKTFPGVERFIVPPLKGVPKLGGAARAAWLQKTLLELRPDLVHLHFAMQGWMNLVLMQCAPLVVTVMGGDVLADQGQLPTRRRRWLLRGVLDRAAVITAQNRFMAQAVQRWGDHQAKTRIVPWGVDLQRFRAGLQVEDLRARHGLPANELVIFCHRLMRPFYNKHVVLRGFARARELGLRATLMISEYLAYPDYRQELRRLTDQLDVGEHVRWVGSIAHDEMPRYWNLTDIAVSMPPSDGAPQSLFETMACETYHVLGDYPTYAELVEDGVTGALVPVGDVEALARALVRAAEDPEHRRQAVALNRARAECELDKDAQQRLMASIYEELLA